MTQTPASASTAAAAAGSPTKAEPQIVAISQQSRFHGETLDAATNDVDLKGVCVSVGDRELLADAHLKLFAGVHYGFIGRNGVGKSTLLKAIGWGILVGWPRAVRALYVDQLEGGDTHRPVIEVVLAADVEAQRIHRQTGVLQAALEAGGKRLPMAVREVKLEQLRAEMEEARQIATKRSGARGFDARKVLVQLEGKVAESEANFDALLAPGEAEAAPAAAQELLDGLFAAALGHLDAGAAEAKARSILQGLGFSHAMQDGPLEQLSGGWRIRVALAQALFLEPDVLLLDEPTNHLDLPAILWLQSYLQTLDATTLVIVSHDRAFLNATVEEIIRLRDGKLTYHTGNYDEYETAMADLALHKEKLTANIEKKREHIEKSIQNGLKAAKKGGDDKKLGMVASRKKKLERLGAEKNEKGHRFRIQRDMVGYHSDRANAVEMEGPDPVTKWKLPEPEELRHHAALMAVEGLWFGYGATLRSPPEKFILRDVTMNVQPGARVALIGANGEGKSTLVKLLMGELQPVKGSVQRHAAAKVGYFSQHQVEQLGASGDTALACLMKMFPGVREQEMRAHLGSFGVKGQLATQPLGQLSGGQSVRVALAATVFPAPHLLVLDEPTNHLDLDTISALIQALQAYRGAVLLVSHDQALVTAVAGGEGGQVWRVGRGRVRREEGGMAAYVAREGRKLAKAAAAASS